jgi:hypothetical protein
MQLLTTTPLRVILSALQIATMPIPASSIFGIYGLEASFTKVLLRELAVLEISLMPSKPFLQATEALLDRIEIWRVWRQKNK